MKSGMAIGIGWMLPWVTSTCSAAAPAETPTKTAARNAAHTKPIRFILFSKLVTYHVSWIEGERDVLPLPVTVLRQLVRCAGVDGAARCLSRRPRKRIVRHSTLRFSR